MIPCLVAEIPGLHAVALKRSYLLERRAENSSAGPTGVHQQQLETETAAGGWVGAVTADDSCLHHN